MEKVKLAQEISDIENSDIERKRKRMRRDKIKEDYSSDEQENSKKIDDSITIPPPLLPSSFITNQPETSSTILKQKTQFLSIDSPTINELTVDNLYSDSFNS